MRCQACGKFISPMDRVKKYHEMPLQEDVNICHKCMNEDIVKELYVDTMNEDGSPMLCEPPGFNPGINKVRIVKREKDKRSPPMHSLW